VMLETYSSLVSLGEQKSPLFFWEAPSLLVNIGTTSKF
jgi:hypothetical protein